MANEDPKLRLRLALSHRKKAQALRARPMEALKGGSPEPKQQESIRRLYSEQLALAESSIARVRDEMRESLTALERQLHAIDLEQTQLSRRATSGEIPPDKANDANRELLTERRRVEQRISGTKNLLDADSPESLGGFIDLPFEEYMRPYPEGFSRASPFELGITFIVPLLMALSVFLPWIAVGRRSYSLIQLGALSELTGAGTRLPSALTHTLWLAYVLAPLAAFPLALLKERRNAAWALSLIGAAAVATGLLPLLVLAFAREGLGAIGALLSAAGPGPWIYGAGGIVLVLLGARRFGPSSSSFAKSARAALLFSVAAICAIAICVAFAFVLPGKARIMFNATVADNETGQLRITCANEGTRSIALYVPWPEERRARSAGSGAVVMGLRVLVREAGASAFRALPNSLGVWFSDGMRLTGMEQITIEPGLRADLVFLPEGLREASIDAEALRIDLCDSEGKPQESFEVLLVRQ